MTRDKNIDMPPLLSRFPSTTPPTTTTMTTQFIEKLCAPGDSDCLSETFFYHNYFPAIVAVVVAVVVIFGLVFCAWFFLCLCLIASERLSALPSPSENERRWSQMNFREGRKANPKIGLEELQHEQLRQPMAGADHSTQIRCQLKSNERKQRRSKIAAK
ncbi:unnamed protein product [Oikopleura dioica]|uniref:Uncharacterized protein n=1 Tax=Oikopleura dioica TaxID=34765 RepID=E4Y0V3_OIKDI|nr:unnamed protein product [Oikopleura dioica]